MIQLQKKTWTEWVMAQPDLKLPPMLYAQKAWNYQEEIIKTMQRNWAAEVCGGKDALRAKIEDLSKQIVELNDLVATLYKTINDLEHPHE